MRRAISVRLGDAAASALEQFTADGESVTEAVNRALVEASERRLAWVALRAEAERLAADATDRAEITAVSETMEHLAAEG